MVEHGIHIGREYRLILIVDHNCRVGPPKESLRMRSTVVQFNLDLKIRLVGIESEPGHSFRAEHTLYLTAPNGYTAVAVLLDVAVHRFICRRAMVLRPVELDTAGYPGACKSNKCRFYDTVVVHKVTLFRFVVSHLHPAAKFGQ